MQSLTSFSSEGKCNLCFGTNAVCVLALVLQSATQYHKNHQGCRPNKSTLVGRLSTNYDDFHPCTTSTSRLIKAPPFLCATKKSTWSCTSTNTINRRLRARFSTNSGLVRLVFETCVLKLLGWHPELVWWMYDKRGNVWGDAKSAIWYH